MDQVQAAIAKVYREEAGKITATLIRVLGNFEAAEDVLQEAVAVALTQWSKAGVPDKPGAWLVTTAKNRAIDQIRMS